jgi:hypothetical protein
MENYPIIKDDIKLNNVLDLIRIHFYIKMIEKGVSLKELSDRELSILCELYYFGGIFSKDMLISFTTLCVEKKLTDNSLQSIRNVLGKARALGIVKRPKANKWVISNDYLPYIQGDRFIFKYIIDNVPL